MSVGWYEASDYAGITTEHLDAYYGYERTIGDPDDGTEEWCFEANFEGRKVTIPWSNLPGQPDRFNCAHCLLAGLALLFSDYRIKVDAADEPQ